MTEKPTAPRRVWLAVVLSLFCTGLGHVYSGRIARGLVLFLLSLLFAPLLVLAALLPMGPAGFILVLVAVAVGPVLYLGATIDSGIQAARHGAGYTLRAFNRPGLYVLFILVGTLYPPGATLGVRALAFQAYRTPMASMAPTLLPGDRFLVNKLALGDDGPRRGDVVIFRGPETDGQDYVKRVIGLPGDRIAVVDGTVLLDGVPLSQERVPEGERGRAEKGLDGTILVEEVAGRRYRILVDSARVASRDLAETRVPDGHLFVLGDHRTGSKDSRHFGPVPCSDVRGIACWIFLPSGSWDRMGAID